MGQCGVIWVSHLHTSASWWWGPTDSQPLNCSPHSRRSPALPSRAGYGSRYTFPIVTKYQKTNGDLSQLDSRLLYNVPGLSHTNCMYWVVVCWYIINRVFRWLQTLEAKLASCRSPNGDVYTRWLDPFIYYRISLLSYENLRFDLIIELEFYHSWDPQMWK